MLYKEQAVAMPNNSQYCEEQLKSIGPGPGDNVHVARHPHVLDTRATLWSHHEKIVVVDRRVAFVGGIDLCPGRWDTKKHEVTFPDTFTNVPVLTYNLAMQRLSELSRDEEEDRGSSMAPREARGSSESEARGSSEVVPSAGRHGIDLSRSKLTLKTSVLPGVDYWNPRAGDFKPSLCGARAWSSDSFNTHRHPRMGWHDVSVVMSGGDMVADVCRHFIQRWLHHRVDKVSKDAELPALIPST